MPPRFEPPPPVPKRNDRYAHISSKIDTGLSRKRARPPQPKMSHTDFFGTEMTTADVQYQRPSQLFPQPQPEAVAPAELSPKRSSWFKNIFAGSPSAPAAKVEEEIVPVVADEQPTAKKSATPRRSKRSVKEESVKESPPRGSAGPTVNVKKEKEEVAEGEKKAETPRQSGGAGFFGRVSQVLGLSPRPPQTPRENIEQPQAPAPTPIAKVAASPRRSAAKGPPVAEEKSPRGSLNPFTWFHGGASPPPTPRDDGGGIASRLSERKRTPVSFFLEEEQQAEEQAARQKSATPRRSKRSVKEESVKESPPRGSAGPTVNVKKEKEEVAEGEKKAETPRQSGGAGFFGRVSQVLGLSPRPPQTPRENIEQPQAPAPTPIAKVAVSPRQSTKIEEVPPPPAVEEPKEEVEDEDDEPKRKAARSEGKKKGGKKTKARKASPVEVAETVEEEDPSLEWKVTELRAFASKRGISLTGAKKKVDILAKIRGGL